MIEEALPFIAGSWRKTLSHKTAPSFNPSTGDVLGSYALGTPEDIDEAVSAAVRAQLAWARVSAFERAAACERVASEIVARRDELALLLSLDQGKPLHAEAYDEVDELVVYFSMAAADATRTVDVGGPPRAVLPRPRWDRWGHYALELAVHHGG